MVRLYVVRCEGKSKVEFARCVMCVGVGMGRGGMNHEGGRGGDDEVDCRVVSEVGGGGEYRARGRWEGERRRGRGEPVVKAAFAAGEGRDGVVEGLEVGF